jgi:hypothetical protein
VSDRLLMNEVMYLKHHIYTYIQKLIYFLKLKQHMYKAKISNTGFSLRVEGPGCKADHSLPTTFKFKNT